MVIKYNYFDVRKYLYSMIIIMTSDSNIQTEESSY